MRIAVITGASSGIGQEFVYQLDTMEKFDEIWVIARRREKLEELSAYTRAFIRPIPLDLTEPDSIKKYAMMLKKYRPRVAVLVNASGYGKYGAFTDIPLEEQLNMIDLNVKAYVALTHITLPYMRQCSRIYNVDSLSAFMPLPYMSTYAATKSYILSFTKSLNHELRKKGIRAIAVSPGWVKTEFFNRALTDDTIKWYNKFYEPTAVVSRAITDMANGKDVSVLGITTKALVMLTRFMPTSAIMDFWCYKQGK